jgi:hypothetical protein
MFLDTPLYRCEAPEAGEAAELIIALAQRPARRDADEIPNTVRCRMTTNTAGDGAPAGAVAAYQRQSPGGGAAPVPGGGEGPC